MQNGTFPHLQLCNHYSLHALLSHVPSGTVGSLPLFSHHFLFSHNLPCHPIASVSVCTIWSSALLWKFQRNHVTTNASQEKNMKDVLAARQTGEMYIKYYSPENTVKDIMLFKWRKGYWCTWCCDLGQVSKKHCKPKKSEKLWVQCIHCHSTVPIRTISVGTDRTSCHNPHSKKVETLCEMEN